MVDWSLNANDCSKFSFRKGKTNKTKLTNDNIDEVINTFIKQSQNTYFRLSDREIKAEEKEPIALFDYIQNQWIAGRYVGVMNFPYKKNTIEAKITPRFGDKQLCRMLEEIYNVKILKQEGASQSKEDVWIKKLISIIWLRQLATANRFGLPRTSKRRVHKGLVIKGRINIRDSIKPLLHNKNVVSEYYTKNFDETILQILSQAYRILSKSFLLNRIPNSALDAINHIGSANITKRRITEAEYKRIKYKSIYVSYKNVVDLSWRIINKKSAFMDSGTGSKESFGLFIDMAEVWELYLSKLLAKKLPNWKVLTQEQNDVYADKFFKRSIRPDIILQNGDKIVVLDAKWKRMQFEYRDFDRSDFFQINTYISYYKNLNYNVVAGGLLYPFEKQIDKSECCSNSWMNDSTTKFIIDGIQMPQVTEKEENINSKEYDIWNEEFIDRIRDIVNP